jgi:hypothetical protein
MLDVEGTWETVGVNVTRWRNFLRMLVEEWSDSNRLVSDYCSCLKAEHHLLRLCIGLWFLSREFPECNTSTFLMQTAGCPWHLSLSQIWTTPLISLHYFRSYALFSASLWASRVVLRMGWVPEINTFFQDGSAAEADCFSQLKSFEQVKKLGCCTVAHSPDIRIRHGA